MWLEKHWRDVVWVTLFCCPLHCSRKEWIYRCGCPRSYVTGVVLPQRKTVTYVPCWETAIWPDSVGFSRYGELDRMGFPPTRAWLVLLFKQISNLGKWLMDICSNVYTLIFRFLWNIILCTKIHNTKKHIITFLLSLRFISLLASCSSSSFFSVFRRDKKEWIFKYYNCTYCISLGWKLQNSKSWLMFPHISGWCRLCCLLFGFCLLSFFSLSAFPLIL